MLENFVIAVKGGIHYMEKDFAVLGTEDATHPSNTEALSNLQIFFRHTCAMLVGVTATPWQTRITIHNSVS